MIKPSDPNALTRFHRWDLTKLKDALEKMALKDIKTGNVRRYSITPTKEHLMCLKLERGESSRTHKRTSKSPKMLQVACQYNPLMSRIPMKIKYLLASYI